MHAALSARNPRPRLIRDLPALGRFVYRWARIYRIGFDANCSRVAVDEKGLVISVEKIGVAGKRIVCADGIGLSDVPQNLGLQAIGICTSSNGPRMVVASRVSSSGVYLTITSAYSVRTPTPPAVTRHFPVAPALVADPITGTPKLAVVHFPLPHGLIAE